ncbi:MAG: stage V sporulation T C-terminal domain-containing protein [Bacillota bacterium]|nr:stage V sporulation T C-terminal domain-containing protein [Bacillota bacterium]
MKATGIVRRIDDLGRVVIPKEIRRTLRIKENDPLEIFTDREGEIIFKKYSPMGDLGDFAQEYVDALHESTSHIALIADEDEIIAINGAPRKLFLNKRLSPATVKLLEEKVSYVGTSARNDIPVEGYETSSQVVTPILKGGALVGAVILLSKETVLGQLERTLCETAANFLAKQLK